MLAHHPQRWANHENNIESRPHDLVGDLLDTHERFIRYIIPIVFSSSTKQTRDVESILVYYWLTTCDAKTLFIAQ